MQADIQFGRVIRTTVSAQPAFPAFIETVEQTIDHIQELPRAVLGLAHWNTAFLALWASVDYPACAVRLAAADRALCTALAAEGWLEELQPV